MKAPAIKPSGLEWAGNIPANWEVASLSSRFEVQLGKMLGPEASAGEHQRSYLGNQHVQWDRVVVDGLPTMSVAPHELERYRVLPGDLLVCEGGEVGRAAVWRGELDECCYQKALHRVRPRDDSSFPRFAYYLLCAAAGRGVFEAEGNRSTIVHLTGEKLRRHRFPFPSFEVQRRIADFLDRKTAAIDTLIAKKEQLLALLAEKRQALITQAVTKGLDPNVPMKESGVRAIGSIPGHWRISRLMHLTPPRRSIMYGIVLPGPHVEGGIPIVKSGDCWPGRLRRDRLKCTTPEIEAPYARARLEPGDIVYAIRGSIGASALVPEELRGANLTQDAARIAPAAGVESSWLLYAVQSDSTWSQLEPGIVGATVKGINIRDLKRPYVPVPPIEEQNRIVAYIRGELRRLDGLGRCVGGQVEKLREYRQATITAAVTGKLDVVSSVRAARATHHAEAEVA